MATDITTGYYSDDCKLAYTLQSGETTTAGHPFFKDQLFGIAEAAGVEDDVVQLMREGVFRTSLKVTGVAWTVGMPIYWKASTAKYTTVSTDGRLVGYAAQPAASADTIAYFIIAESATPRQTRAGIATLASGTVDVADTHITATSVVLVTYATASTKGATLKAVTDPGAKFTITAIKEADGSTETAQVGTVGYVVFY